MTRKQLATIDRVVSLRLRAEYSSQLLQVLEEMESANPPRLEELSARAADLRAEIAEQNAELKKVAL